MRPPSFEAFLAPLAPLATLEGGAWVVGGSVRDALLGRPPAFDLDVAVGGDAAHAARVLSRAHGGTRFRLSRAFGAWRVQGRDLPFQIDITPLQGASLEEDLRRRDLTINALAVPIAPGQPIVDLHGGLRDLAERRLRLVSDTALADDPVRLLRLARIAEQTGFTVHDSARAVARRDATLVWSAPGERVADELARIVSLPAPDHALALLDELAVLGALVPELEQSRGLDQSEYHQHDVLGHVMEVVRHAREIADDPEPIFRSRAARVAEVMATALADELTSRGGLMLVALLHDMAKPATRAVTPEGRVTFFGHDRLGAEMADALMRRLRTSARLRDFVVRGVRWHLPLGFLVHRTPLSLRQIDRYLRSTAPSQAEIIVLSVADRLATQGPRTSASAIQRHLVLAREMMDAHFSLADRPPMRPLLAGDEVASALGREPGPWLVPIIDALREGQTVGVLRTRDQALRFVRGWGDAG